MILTALSIFVCVYNSWCPFTTEPIFTPTHLFIPFYSPHYNTSDPTHSHQFHIHLSQSEGPLQWDAWINSCDWPAIHQRWPTGLGDTLLIDMKSPMLVINSVICRALSGYPLQVVCNDSFINSSSSSNAVCSRHLFCCGTGQLTIASLLICRQRFHSLLQMIIMWYSVFQLQYK